MYMNIISQVKDDGSVDHKFSVWRLLLKVGEWELVSEMTGFDYFPLAINPFDGNTVYLWSETQECLASVSLRNGNFELHNELECSSNGQTLSSVQCNREMDTEKSRFSMFVLPRWLYRIPRPPR
ncbi:unnamed protein product [Thlaspi arvense]|uniref:F-box protein At3g26010-like beta-propeller domain-containing protein n=1 Tax=Thlaspi arvense TaxID=13288 RepID=A0AAU9RQU8_THLAR|nr:unnamed protein product [Thlaspi arvense]